MHTLDDDLKLALELADRAACLAMDYLGCDVGSTLKADGTIVTEADKAVEGLIRSSLVAARPGDGILGEEFGSLGGAERRWIVDPIDGTTSFANRDSDWRVHLALEIREEIAVAVIVAPVPELRWWATRGCGAFESAWRPFLEGIGTPLAVSTNGDPDVARIQAYPLKRMTKLLPKWNVSKLASVVPLEVARGGLDAFVFDGCHAWDHAPWILIVEEAGGQFTDWDGGRSAHRRGGLFSNKALHPVLAAALGIGPGV